MTPAAIQLTRQIARAESELAGWERRAERYREILGFPPLTMLADVESAADLVHSRQLQLAAADTDD